MIEPGTPLPWSVAYGFDTRDFGGEGAPATYVSGPNPEQIGLKLATPFIEGAWDDDEEAAANAAYIVHACNTFPALVEALEAMVAEWVDYTTINNLGDPYAKHNMKLARAALSLAKGEAA